MAERNCDKHTKKVTVKIDRSRLEKKQHSNLIAALLRQIADYTDGWCATEHAKDVDLDSASGMVFYFTTDERRDLFKNRISYYLREDIDTALSR